LARFSAFQPTVRRRIIIKGLNETLQADLVEMIPYAKENQQFIAINIPSDVMTIITTADVGLKSELVERGF
jgi:hypothetical protein